MVIVLRTALLGGARVEKTVVAASVFVDTLTTMACGALLATLALAWRGSTSREVLLVGLAMFVITGLPAIPAVFAQLVNLLGISRINPANGRATAGRAAERIAARLVVDRRRLAAARDQFVGRAASDWRHRRWPLGQLATTTAAAALAVVAGFLTMIPGGFIGREFVLTELLAPAYGPALAALSAILLRLVWLVAEVVVSCILYFLARGER